MTLNCNLRRYTAILTFNILANGPKYLRPPHLYSLQRVFIGLLVITLMNLTFLSRIQRCSIVHTGVNDSFLLLCHCCIFGWKQNLLLLPLLTTNSTTTITTWFSAATNTTNDDDNENDDNDNDNTNNNDNSNNSSRNDKNNVYDNDNECWFWIICVINGCPICSSCQNRDLNNRLSAGQHGAWEARESNQINPSVRLFQSVGKQIILPKCSPETEETSKTTEIPDDIESNLQDIKGGLLIEYDNNTIYATRRCRFVQCTNVSCICALVAN